jgi:hypothetical protein
VKSAGAGYATLFAWQSIPRSLKKSSSNWGSLKSFEVDSGVAVYRLAGGSSSVTGSSPLLPRNASNDFYIIITCYNLGDGSTSLTSKVDGCGTSFCAFA